MKQPLTIELLKQSAKEFCESESIVKNKELFGVTDGKKVGTYVGIRAAHYTPPKFCGSSLSSSDILVS